jgi:hypothetical protein
VVVGVQLDLARAVDLVVLAVVVLAAMQVELILLLDLQTLVAVAVVERLMCPTNPAQQAVLELL